MRTLDEVIKHEELDVESCEAVISRCDLNNPHEKDVAYDTEEYAERHRQIAKWLKQLQKIQETVREYRNVPMEVMDSDDAFTRICGVVDEMK